MMQYTLAFFDLFFAGVFVGNAWYLFALSLMWQQAIVNGLKLDRPCQGTVLILRQFRWVFTWAALGCVTAILTHHRMTLAIIVLSGILTLLGIFIMTGSFGKFQRTITDHVALRKARSLSYYCAIGSILSSITLGILELPPLHQAIVLGRTERAVQLAKTVPDVNAPDPRWEITPLHHAVIARRIKVAQALLARSADPNRACLSGYYPIHDAVLARQPDWVELLLKNGADPNSRTRSGTSPLHLASQLQALNMAALLMDHGADSQAVDEQGRTPLDLAKDDAMRLVLQKHSAISPAPANTTRGESL